MNAIGTQLRDPLNSGLTRWRMAVINEKMDAAAELGRNPVRPCLNLNVLTESVHKICRQNLSKIKLCDWPNNLDATSWQV